MKRNCRSELSLLPFCQVRTQSSFLFSLCPLSCEDTARRSSPKTRCHALILDFPGSRAVRTNFCSLQITQSWARHVAHSCNLSYLGSEERRIAVWDQPRQKKKVSETVSHETSWAWWCTSINPTRQGVEVGGSQSEAGPGKSMRRYLKNNHSSKS
jgi:hypothetical protein